MTQLTFTADINVEALRTAVEGVEDNNRINGGRWSDWDSAAAVADLYDAPLCPQGQAVIVRAIESDGESLGEDLAAVEVAVHGCTFIGSFLSSFLVGSRDA